MDTKKKIFFMSALALLACSCQEDKIADPTGTAAPGVEVNFGGMLGDGDTRTIYGQEANGAFPIYWVNGDQVLIASPECANNGGVGSATYAVSVNADNQNYATSMDKTGEIGVRWGENETGTFYSVYPAARHTAFNTDLSSARLTVTTQQDNTWNPADNTVAPDMSACFMWAKTEGVAAGSIVNLAYKPLSTALRFTVTGPASGDPVTITYIRLYAPNGTALSGTFNVDFNNIGADGMPAVSAISGQTFNYASMNAATTQGSYLTLQTGENATVQLFFLLEGETTMTDQWRIVIATADGRLFTKNLTGDGSMTLKPGQIHKIASPLPALSEAGEWDTSNWMVNIQRNVYLSEISIPGSWNSLNSEYQNGTTIAQQYNAGVRAFHLDTRWRANANRPNNNEITDLGIANGGNTYYEGVFNTGDQYMTQDAPSFADALRQITDNVKDDEYMVVYCTFAQGSAQPTDGRNWRNEIATACSNNDRVIDARTLTVNSTVQDVLGKVIVIVSTMYENEEVQSKTFFVNLQNELDEDEFTTTDYFERNMTFNNTTNSEIKLYATYAQITADRDGANDGNGELDGRGYGPTLDEREAKCANVLNWSQSNYASAVGSGSFKHNAWIFLGLGGYVYEMGSLGITHTGDSQDRVNNHLIPWINRRLTDMESNGAFYPVGIVFMNHTVTHPEETTVDITQTVEDILMLNNRYRKAYDPDRSPVDGSPVGEGGSTVRSAAPGYSSGMVDNRQNAIVWE